MADDRREHAVNTMARHAIHTYADEYATSMAPRWAREIQQRMHSIAGDRPDLDTVQAAFGYLVMVRWEDSDG